MYGSGAGTGMEATQAERRPIPWARPRGLTGWGAAGAGTSAVSSCVLCIGTTSPRSTGATTSVSGWCVPEFCGLVEGRKCSATPALSGREARNVRPSSEYEGFCWWSEESSRLSEQS